MNIRTCIIDDSAADLESVKNTIETIFDASSISFEFTSITDPAQLQSADFDLYILDIELNGTDGFSLAERIEADTPDAAVIFCTGHEELVFHSYNYKTLYFVRKSHLKSDLENAIRKYVRYRKTSTYTIHNRKNIVTLPVNIITHLNVVKNDLFIFTFDKKQYTERKSLSTAMNDLSEQCFLRISMNTAVNAQYIREIISGKVILSDGTRMNISRDRIKAVVRDYEKYLLWR